MTDFETIRKDLNEFGVSGPHKLFDPQLIVPLQEKLYAKVKEYLIGDSPDLSLVEKLRLPLKEDIPYKYIFDLRANMEVPVVEFAKHPKVKEVFQNLFDKEAIALCQKFHSFRGNFPEFIPQATGWHQDAETFYTHGWEEWKYPFYVMWTSLNGADPTNSVEFALKSHNPPRLYAQHYTNSMRPISDISEELADKPTTKIDCQPGDVYFINNLVLHRSILNLNKTARFSVDVRYCDPASSSNLKHIDKKLYFIKGKFICKNTFLYKWLAASPFVRKLLGCAPR